MPIISGVGVPDYFTSLFGEQAVVAPDTTHSALVVSGKPGMADSKEVLQVWDDDFDTTSVLTAYHGGQVAVYEVTARANIPALQVRAAPGNDIPFTVLVGGAVGTTFSILGSGVARTLYGLQTSVITSGALPTQAFSSGVAAQVNTARDSFLAIPFTGDATNTAATLKIELSPDNVTYSTLDTLSIAAALNLTGALNVPVTIAVPAGWYVKLTAVHGTIGTATKY